MSEMYLGAELPERCIETGSVFGKAVEGECDE